MATQASFLNLELGSTKPTFREMETIHVVISQKNLLGNYAKAFVNEAYRVVPLRAEAVGLTAQEVEAYSNYLLTKRIECVNMECKDYRKLKVLYIPAWIQYNLSLVGRVTKYDVGLQLLPVMENPSSMTFEEAVAISEKIGSFQRDLQIVHDAMPRSVDGDDDVMSTAMIADYVCSMKEVSHVAFTYVTAFLGMKVQEEAMFKVLYRLRYDDVQYIATALTTQKGLF